MTAFSKIEEFSRGVFSEQAVDTSRIKGHREARRDGHARSLGPLIVVLPGLATSYFPTVKFRDCITGFWI
jgi:hypothetical protein